jgi:hypothetical protein
LSTPDDWADFEAMTRPSDMAAKAGAIPNGEPAPQSSFVEEATVEEDTVEESPEDFVEPPHAFLGKQAVVEASPKEFVQPPHVNTMDVFLEEQAHRSTPTEEEPTPEEVQSAVKAWLDDTGNSEETGLLETTEGTDADEGGDPMIHVLVKLKAYAVVAKSQLSEDFKGALRSGLVNFIVAFGDDTGKELVTEYAQVIGKLKATHPSSPGIGGYLLDAIDDNVMKGQDVLTQLEHGEYKNSHVVDHTKLGLEEMPGFFLKLRASETDFQAQLAKMHEGKGKKAIAMYTKRSKTSTYNTFLAKITAKYKNLQQGELSKREVGAIFAMQEALRRDTAANVSAYDLPGPLPTAGKKGSQKMRALDQFNMPSAEVMAKEALAEAQKYMAAIAKRDMSPEAVAAAIRAEMEGVTLRITTDHRMFAESHQSPTIRIVGTKGEVNGTIDALPLNGETLTQTFNAVGPHPMGEVQFVILTSDAKARNPWLCTKLEVQVGRGNPWVDMAPNGKTSLQDGWWLDGAGGQQGPYYRLMRQDKVMLMPTTQQMGYSKLNSGHAPRCVTIPDKQVPDEVGGAACISGDRAKLKTACGKVSQCQGFTYTTGVSKGGQGCLKYRCLGGGISGTEKGMDYYTRQAIEYGTKQPTEHCPMTCGFQNRTFYGRVICRTIKSGDEVSLEQCQFHQPALKKPATPSKDCPSTPVCVEYKSSIEMEGFIENKEPPPNMPFTLLGKPTAQSSTIHDGAASRAVDGNTNGKYADGSCTHTQAGGDEWWRVDLKYEYEIESVSLYNRVDCCGDRLIGVQVSVSENDQKHSWQLCGAAAPAPPALSGEITLLQKDVGTEDEMGWQKKATVLMSGSAPPAPAGAANTVLRKLGRIFLVPPAPPPALAPPAPVPGGPATTVKCGKNGRYVWVSQPAKKYLTLCEVKVQAKPATGAACSNACGLPAKTTTGKVWCQERDSGKIVSDDQCAAQQLDAPAVPLRYCEATDPCPKAFSLGDVNYRYSSCQLAHNKQTEYLDRQTLNCSPGEVMTKFTFHGCGGENFKYKAVCKKPPQGFEKSVIKTTPCALARGKDIQYLDRQNVDCGKGSVLTGFRFEGCGGNNMRYAYTCATPKAPLTIFKTQSSGCHIARGEKLQYLDQQQPSCGINGVIQGFHLVGCGGNKMKYNVKCGYA